MPPRNPELPEGTDHIINGAMETNASAGSGSSGGLGGGGGSGAFAGGPAAGTGGPTAGSTGGLAGGGSSSGFIGGSDTAVLGDDTGGLAASGGASGGRGQGERAVSQFKDGAQNLRQQATSKAREYAEDGKGRATTALTDFSGVIRETADSIDEKLGAEYGQYARRAADAVEDFSRNISNKSVDELYDDARDVVRKSPAVAIGVAAAVGFALVRLVKAGIPEQQKDVEFEPDPNFGTTTTTGTPPKVTPSTGV